MIIDDYLAAMDRGLRQNVHVGRIEEPITLKSSRTRITSTLDPLTNWLPLINRS